MEGKTEFVKQGVWINYDLPRWRAYQVLVTDERAQIISNAIAVALSLTLPRLLRIAKLFFPKKSDHKKSNARVGLTGEQNDSEASPERAVAHRLDPIREEGLNESQTNVDFPLEEYLYEEHSQGSGEDEPDQPLPTSVHLPQRVQLPTPRFGSRIASGFVDTIYSAETFESAAAQLASHHLGMRPIVVGETTRTFGNFPIEMSTIMKNFKEEKLTFTLISALILMLFGIFIGEQVVAISVAGIVGDSVGLSASPKCGNWQYIGNNDTETWRYQSQSLAAAQRRSTIYIDNCYREPFAAEDCKVYNNRTIAFSEEHNASCPFLGDVCLYGQISAYALETHWVDSNVLGINAPKRYHFRRKTTCSPIVTNYSYIVPVDRDGLSQLGEYYYGNNETSLLSMTQPADFGWGHSEYEHTWGYFHFRMHGTSLYGAGENRNILRPEFLPPASDVSLLFIRPRMLRYSEPNDDPIFPAQTLAEDGLNYLNGLPYATVLGCVDIAEVCDPATGQIWIPRNFSSWKTTSPEWKAGQMKNLFFLLSIGLAESNTWNAINYGVSLDAQNKIIAPGGVSLPLAREQWKIESRRFFEVSLAMLQGKIYDVVRGRDADETALQNTLDKLQQPICGMVKFPTAGWTNISLFWLVALPSCAFLLWFATIEVEEKLILAWFYLKLLKPCFKPCDWLYTNVVKPCLKGIWFALKWVFCGSWDWFLYLPIAAPWFLDRWRKVRVESRFSVQLQAQSIRR